MTKDHTHPKPRTKGPRVRKPKPKTGGGGAGPGIGGVKVTQPPPPPPPPLQGLFWVRVTHRRNSRGLRVGQHLVLEVGDDSVTVFRAVHQLGVLEPLGDKWVRTHGYSSCVFVKYGRRPDKRFQVEITAAR